MKQKSDCSTQLNSFTYVVQLVMWHKATSNVVLRFLRQRQGKAI